LKILYDCTYLRNKHTGVDKYFFELISEILKIDDKNIYTILLDTRYDTLNLVELIKGFKNVSLIRIYSPLPLQVIYTSFFLPFYLWFLKYDIYHNPFMFGPLFKISKKKLKIIITVHDLYHRAIPHATSWHFSLLLRLFGETAQKKADQIIAISNSTKSDIKKYLGISETRIRVIYQGLPLWRTKNVDKTTFNVDSIFRQKYILTVGWMLPHKGLDDLIEGFLLAVSKHKLSDLLLVSAGAIPEHHPFVESIKQRVSQANLGGLKIKIMGYVSDQEIHHLYNYAQIVVVPSLYEGFGLSVLEAMSFEKPVIIRNSPALEEVAGGAALVFKSKTELADAIFELMSNRVKSTQLIQLASKNLERFSSKTQAVHTLMLYKSKISSF
jgi:glycosyltransferase involved in cell wall biosynthesis